jgi:hypothetical protein
VLKINIIFPAVTLMLWSLALGAMAYSTERDNWDVDGLNGGVTVSATLTARHVRWQRSPQNRKY